MANLCDYIEEYLSRLLEGAQDGVIEIQRSELAGKFRCVPSQINYVLLTRFSPARGYLVESRRGGGGFIRITRLPLGHPGEILRELEAMGDLVSQQAAEHFIGRMLREGLVTPREASLMRAAVNRRAIGLELPLRDRVRARLLRGMTLSLLAGAGGR